MSDQHLEIDNYRMRQVIMSERNLDPDSENGTERAETCHHHAVFEVKALEFLEVSPKWTSFLDMPDASLK